MVGLYILRVLFFNIFAFILSKGASLEKSLLGFRELLFWETFYLSRHNLTIEEHPYPRIMSLSSYLSSNFSKFAFLNESGEAMEIAPAPLFEKNDYFLWIDVCNILSITLPV